MNKEHKNKIILEVIMSMKKSFLSLLLILSMTLSLLSPVGTVKAVNTNTATPSTEACATGALSPEEEAKFSDQKDFTQITTKEEMCDYLEEYSTKVNELDTKNKASRKASPSATEATLSASTENPSFVDNSTSACFPVIRSQGSIGSCTTWATAYYQLTYEKNRAAGTTASSTSNQISPMFLYNLLNHGENVGASVTGAIHFLTEIGSSSYNLGPSVYDYKSWAANEAAWKSAQENRIEDAYEINLNPQSYSTYITGPDDSDLDALKTALANGNILSFTTAFDTFNYTTIPVNSEVPANTAYAGQQIVKSCDKYVLTSSGARDYGWHRMTLVGYNDNIWIDINNNGIVEENEKGAFKVANSHGSNYGNSGFTWFSYDALNLVSSVSNVPTANRHRNSMYDVYGYQVLPASKKTQLYAKFSLNTARRNEVRITITATKGNVTKTYSPSVFSGNYNYGQFSFDGNVDLDSSFGTFVFDLNNVIPDISADTLADYTWSINIQDTTNNSYPLYVNEVSILDKQNDESYSANIIASSLNGSSATYSIDASVPDSAQNTTTIYYKGYSNPYIHYQKAGGTWTIAPGVKMTETNELTGYTHKATILLGTSTTLTACFNDGNGNWDSNNGTNYTFGTGVYTYSNGVITRIDSPDPTPTPTATPIVTPTPTANPNTNKTTIYYKGYSPAYIHYKIGNGNWTNAPGVAMESTTEQTGYTHKITIDLGTADTLTACFNNGSGSWDSNNGNNYTFSAGTYGYTNGTIVELDNNLRVTNFSPSTPVGGQNTTLYLTVSAAGGIAPYTYSYGYILSDREVSIGSNLSSTTIGFTPYQVGTYTLFVDVKDAAGTTVRGTISDFIVEGPKVSALKTSVASPQKVGTSITITGELANVQLGSYDSYTYSVTKNGVTQTLNTNSNHTATWTPTEAGTYTITFTFQNYLGATLTKSIEYVINDVTTNQTTIYYKGYTSPYIHYKIGTGNWTSVPGVPMVATTEKAGYTHKIIIDLEDATNLTVCFNDGNGNWDSCSGANYSFAVGTYTYSSGTITKID